MIIVIVVIVTIIIIITIIVIVIMMDDHWWQCKRKNDICGASHLWVSPPDVQGEDSSKGGPAQVRQQQVSCIWGHLVELKDSGCQHSQQSCVATLWCKQPQVTVEERA